jgi:hypothetical protein
MKNIFKVTLLVITIIFSSSSVLAQSNDKKANAIEEMVTAMGGMKIMMLPILSNGIL